MRTKHTDGTYGIVISIKTKGATVAAPLTIFSNFLELPYTFFGLVALVVA